MNTTLNLIRSHYPCPEGWEKLLRHLGKTKADDEPLPLRVILESNGLDYALWCLRAVPDCDKEARLFAVWCARQVQHLMTDPRSLAALDVAERHANNEATDQELAAARDAVWDAASTDSVACDAAWSAAWDAARYAANGAARSAVLATVLAAAWDAARYAARYAVWDAAKSAVVAAARAADRQEQEKKFIEMFCLGESK